MTTRELSSKESLFNLAEDAWGNSNIYNEEYKSVIRRRELFRIPFLHQSPQINYRQLLVNHLKTYAIKKRLSLSGLHLCIYIMDIFMDNHSIAPEKLHLVANTCLLIAAKFEENCSNVPKLEELNATVNNRYVNKEYKLVEIMILKFFDWYLILPTAAHYIHYFMQASICNDDLEKTKGSYRTLMFQMEEYVQSLLDVVIDDYHFMQFYTPSKLAAAVISMTREYLELSSWTDQLTTFTDYSKEEIYEAVYALKNFSHVWCFKCNEIKADQSNI